MRNRMLLLTMLIACTGIVNITVLGADSRVPSAVKPVQKLPGISQPAAQSKLIENVTTARWSVYKEGAKHAVRAYFPLWVQCAKFANGSINGPNMTGGKLQSINIIQILKTDMINQGIPAPIADGFMVPLTVAWNNWAESIQVPGVAWYPSFASFPGPVAPPTANIPHPLAALPQNQSFLAQSTLLSSIKARLAAEAASPEAAKAINDFCQWFYNGFNIWRLNAIISEVSGTGNVPSYAPPNVNVGPVVNGTISGCKITPLPNWP